ncbi:MAG: ATP-dependent RecD-like DNA helicase [Oscillospiraceae bacterium]|nr:ATP-dependent RecD-like DNA helicase [Oscillospiraceae bacterium]
MESIQAVVEETVFRNEENGYSVVQVRLGRQRVAAVGTLPPLVAGERLDIEGEWVEHPQYGRQIKVHSAQAQRPTTLMGVERYLGSGLVQGVGPATAKRIVAAFGRDALDILQFNPERLLEIPGIGEKRARVIAESFAQQVQTREAMVLLQGYGITPALAIKIFKAYGDQVQAVLRSNPYRLVEDVQGVGFRTADNIAATMGIEPQSQYRLSAGLKYALQEAGNAGGHTYLPRPALLRTAQQLLHVEEEPLDLVLDALILDQQLLAQEVDDEIAVYMPASLAAEQEVAVRLRGLLSAMPQHLFPDAEGALGTLEGRLGITLHPQQRQAVLLAVRSGMLVVTGGPGTGKTTIINSILRLLGEGTDVALAAPTGRAAKRMTEATGVEAKTLHRMLEYGGDEGRFARGESNPLDCDTVIVDEMSMVDIFLMRGLLRALLPGTRLIMVGDADQLPSVGAGNVLRDILNSGAVPTVRLTEIFRQDERSMIVVNAHRINRGEMPLLNVKGSDFFLDRQAGATQAAQSIVDLCESRLPAFLGVDSVRQIQVLAPTKKGDCGVRALNALLQARFNPRGPGAAERVRGDTLLRVGDKVMQVRNNYQLGWQRKGPLGWEQGEGVFNGDMGFIQAMDEEERTVTVCYDDDRVAAYEESQLEDLDLAYCVSVHKSQGSEFPVVVMPVVGGPPMLLTRNLFYTAVTRARQMVVLVGREGVIEEMVQNSHIARRYSALAQRLRALTAVEGGA